MNAGKVFAPIGLIYRGVPPHYVMATAFLVSPCYVLTAYHAVFGHENSEPETDQDYSMTFHLRGRSARAVPVMYGAFYEAQGEDWTLLRLDADAEHPCLGETAGWLRLADLRSDEIVRKSLSIAAYPSDKSVALLWRQDRCHLFQKLAGNNVGLWTTDCATLPRASGAPIFFLQDGVLNAVGIMHGHRGEETPQILPRWTPNRANLVVGIPDILEAHRDLLQLIDRDIDQFHAPNPAQLRPFHYDDTPPFFGRLQEPGERA
jgi:V8-like Glu-specific endopeptidase